MPNARGIYSALLAFGAFALTEPPAVYLEVPLEDRIEVEWSGCASELAGPVCRVRPGASLVLWVPPEQVEGALSVELGRDVLAAEIDAVQLGRQVRVTLPDALPEPLPPLSLRDGDRVRWRIAMRPEPRYPRLEEANELSREEALELLDPARAANEEERAAVLSRRARLLVRGEQAAGISALRASAQAWDDAGVVSRAAQDMLVASYYLVDKGLSQRALGLELLRELRARSSLLPPASLVALANIGAIAESERGDLRAQLRLAREASSRAQRIGMDRDWADAELVIAKAMERLGRGHEAHRLLLELEDWLAPDSCTRVIAIATRSWIELQAHDAAVRETGWRPLRTTAAALHGPDSCLRPNVLANALVNHALALIQAGRFAEAGRPLRQARDMNTHLEEVESWIIEAEGRLAVGRGRTEEALEAYDRLAAFARLRGNSDAAWRADIGRAQAHLAEGDPEAARRALERSEHTLDREVSLVPLGEGRDAFATRKLRGSRMLVDLLLAQGRTAEALDAYRRARVRAVLALSQRERLNGAREEHAAALEAYQALRDEVSDLGDRAWDIPEDERDDHERAIADRSRAARASLDDILGQVEAPGGHPPIPPTELVLAIVRSEGRWAAIMRQDADADVFPLRETIADSIAPLSRHLEDQLAQATGVRVLTAGEWDRVDIHALEINGEPLLARVPVIYSTDVGFPGRPEPRAGAVLLAADPSSDLALARREAAVLESAFAAQGVDATLLLGADVSRSALLAGFETSTIAHFAGHAASGGATGWHHVLRARGAEAVSPADVLLLDQVPDEVVLSACASAEGTPGVEVASLGMAQAFLFAGTEVVLATTRPVSDQMAAELAGELAREASASPWGAETMRRAVLALRDQHPGGWSAYRLLVR